MPRKSVASLAVVPPIRAERPRLHAPADLSPAQARTWRCTVDALPSDWFTAEHEPLLREYCRMVERAGQLEAMAAKVQDPAGLCKLTRAQVAVSATIAGLARSMRLTQLSRMKAETAASRAGVGQARPGIEALFSGT